MLVARYLIIHSEGEGFAYKSLGLPTLRSQAAPRGLARQLASRDIAMVFKFPTRHKQLYRSFLVHKVHFGRGGI